MEKVFDMHVHYTFDLPLAETIALFRKEFLLTGTEKCCFLSLPHKEKADISGFDGMQNLKGLYLKRVFQPNAYAFAGLVHPFEYTDERAVATSFEKQAIQYASVGYDGMKMLEGYPSLLRDRKGVPLNAKLYDGYYSFMEKNGLPIVMHAANPTENWDVSTATPDAIRAGRVYDASYPTKAEITAQVFDVMKKHPKLKLILAHWGFMADDRVLAEQFLGDYENTCFDITPGGEQYFYMEKDWSYWAQFIEKYGDRILYGTDTYAFPGGEGASWEKWVLRRPALIRGFFETNTEHEYLGEKFMGHLLATELREKIYRKNAERIFGKPKNIEDAYILQTAENLLGTKQKSAWAEQDLLYILQNVT